MPAPRVSVNLPVFNGGRKLARQLESIAAQTCGDFQIQLTDNASTDETEEVGRAFAAKDRRCVYRRNSRNMGFAFSYYRNLYNGLDSEFMVYASHNDYWHPQYLAECLRALDENKDAAVAYSWCQFVDHSGRPAGLFGPDQTAEPYRDDFDLADPDPKKRYLNVIGRLGMCTAYYGLMRNEALLANLPWLSRPNAAGDNYLLAALALGHKLIQIPKAFFFREIPAIDDGFVQRQARLKKFGLGDREFSSVADSYLSGFLSHLSAHEALFTACSAFPLTPAEKEEMVKATSAVLMGRYRAQLEAEIQHNMELAGRGSFYAASASDPAAREDCPALNFFVRNQAHQIMNRSLNYFPKFPGLYYSLALILILLGRVPEARAALEEELRNNPTHRESREIMARLRQG